MYAECVEVGQNAVETHEEPKVEEEPTPHVESVTEEVSVSEDELMTKLKEVVSNAESKVDEEPKRRTRRTRN